MKYSIGLKAIQDERNKQLAKYSIEQDAENYKARTLAYAAMGLLICNVYDQSYREERDLAYDAKPQAFEVEYWEALLNLPYSERMVIAGAWLAAQIDVDYYRASGKVPETSPTEQAGLREVIADEVSRSVKAILQDYGREMLHELMNGTVVPNNVVGVETEDRQKITDEQYGLPPYALGDWPAFRSEMDVEKPVLPLEKKIQEVTIDFADPNRIEGAFMLSYTYGQLKETIITYHLKNTMDRVAKDMILEGYDEVKFVLLDHTYELEEFCRLYDIQEYYREGKIQHIDDLSKEVIVWVSGIEGAWIEQPYELKYEIVDKMDKLTTKNLLKAFDHIKIILGDEGLVPVFHLVFPVQDLAAYCQVKGLNEYYLNNQVRLA